MAGATRNPFPFVMNRQSPRASVGDRKDYTLAALVSSSAWLQGEVLACEPYRVLRINVDYAAATAGGYIQVGVLGSDVRQTTGGATTPPAVDDDVWAFLPYFDAANVSTATAGTAATGADYTLDYNFAVIPVYPALFQTPAAGSGSTEIRLSLPFNIADSKWCHVVAREAGSTGNPGTLTLTYSLST